MNEQITERVNTYIRIKNIMKVKVAARFGWVQPQFRNLGNVFLRLWVRSPCEPHGHKNESATLTAADSFLNDKDIFFFYGAKITQNYPKNSLKEHFDT